MSIIETEEWCKEEGIDFHMRFLTGPDFHAVSSLSDTAKIKLRDYYLQYVNTSLKAPMIVKYLNNQLGKHKPSAVEEFKKFMDFLDTTRNTNWKKIFPKIVGLLD
jgi:sulfur relay (sulfurtransferase) DsrC/TusE family protein